MNVSLPTLNSFKVTTVTPASIASKGSSFAGTFEKSMKAGAGKLSSPPASYARKSDGKTDKASQPQSKDNVLPAVPEIKAETPQPQIPAVSASARQANAPAFATPQVPSEGQGNAAPLATSADTAANGSDLLSQPLATQPLVPSFSTAPQEADLAASVVPPAAISTDDDGAKGTSGTPASGKDNSNVAIADSTGPSDATDLVAAMQSLNQMTPLPTPPASPVAPVAAAKSSLDAVAGVSPVGKSGAAGKPTATSASPKPAPDSQDKHKSDLVKALQTSDASTSTAPQEKVESVVQQITPQHATTGTATDGTAATALQQLTSAAAPADQQSSQVVQANVESQVTVPLPTPPAPADAIGSSSVHSAQLIQSINQSEMKLGLQSQEFGDISISTTLNKQSISAQISIDHAELGKALAFHLPAIEEKLSNAYGVQARVAVQDAGQNAAGGGTHQGETYNRSRGGQSATYSGSSSSRTPKGFVSPSAVPQPVETARLDIRI